MNSIFVKVGILSPSKECKFLGETSKFISFSPQSSNLPGQRPTVREMP